MKIAVPLIIDIPDDRLPAMALRAGLCPPERGQASWYQRFVRRRVQGVVNASFPWADDPGVHACLNIDWARLSSGFPARTEHTTATGPQVWASSAHP